MSSVTITSVPLESSTEAADPHNFVGTSAFYFVVVGIPVIVLVVFCVLAGCCCCCTSLSYRALQQRRRGEKQAHFARTSSTIPNSAELHGPVSVPETKGEMIAAKLQPPVTLYSQQGSYIAEMSAPMEGPPPQYDAVGQQQVILDNGGRLKV